MFDRKKINPHSKSVCNKKKSAGKEIIQTNDKTIVDQNLQIFSRNTRVFFSSMIRLMIPFLF